MADPRPAPLPEGERQGLLDALRGVALLGILIVNVEIFATPVVEGWAGGERTGLDTAAWWLVIAVFQLKSYLLFAFLFGYGIAVMLRRWGDGATPRYLRRMAGLLVLGVVHALFFFVGDILTTYAILGVAALPLARASRSTLRGFLIGVTATGVFLSSLVALAIAVAGPGDLGDPESARRVHSQGGFLEVAALEQALPRNSRPASRLRTARHRRAVTARCTTSSTTPADPSAGALLPRLPWSYPSTLRAFARCHGIGRPRL